MAEMTCPCGSPSLEGDHLCARCRYYQTVFHPPTPEFESKRERAMRAISVKKEMKKSVRMVNIE